MPLYHLLKAGVVRRCKLRIVPRRDKHVEDKDCKHTFSPIAKFTIVRVLIALAAANAWDIQQVDVNNGFLHGYFDDEVYMTPPQGYTKAQHGQACRLIRSIYGLKQACRC